MSGKNKGWEEIIGEEEEPNKQFEAFLSKSEVNKTKKLFNFTFSKNNNKSVNPPNQISPNKQKGPKN